MNLRTTLTTALLGIALAVGTQTIAMAEASAKPFDTLSKSRSGGKRTHKKAGKSSSKKKSSSSKSKSTSSRRVTRTTTRPSTTTTRTRTNGSSTRSRTTTRYRRPASHSTTQRRTRTTTTRHHHHGSTRTVRHVEPRRTYRTTTTRRGATSRRTYYRSGSTRHHHSHTTVNHYDSGSSNGYSSSNRRGTGSSVEAYVTGGLGLSGFASNEITDLPLPGAGYNVGLGAKGKLFGAELGLNGGGYTFDPGSASADIAMVGLSGDLKLQPAFGFFEPYIAAGIGGYAMKDAVIEEAATGLGLRVGVGADFRFRDLAVRLAYQHGTYGLEDVNGQYQGDLVAHTETLGANLVVYF